MSESINTNLDHNFAARLIEKWAPLTAEQEEERSRLPLKILLGEAVDLAEVIDKYFEDQVVHGKLRLGLRSVIDKGPITPQTAAEIRELQLAAAATHSRYLVLVEQTSDAPVQKADEILNELRSALTFVLEDSGNARGEEQLLRLRDEYADATSHDAMAMALEGYGELAAQYKEDLKGLGGFNETWIDQAIQIAQALRQRSADKLTGAIPQEQQDTLRLRNRLLGALTERMRGARKCIRYVFRDYPEIAQMAGSDYLRSKQRARRKMNTEDSGSDAIDDYSQETDSAAASEPGTNPGAPTV